MTHHFDEAGQNAIKAAERYAAPRKKPVIVMRDLLGRNSVAITGGVSRDDVVELREDLRENCAPFVLSDPILFIDEAFAPELITESPNRHPAPWPLSSSGQVTVIERETMGADWLNIKKPSSLRVVLYGFKGGVGRSSATFALARHLANKGKMVLVVDLDLESPGIGTMLVPDPQDLPPHGIIDHLVEYPITDAKGLELVTRSTAVGPTGSGEVWLGAAAGQTVAADSEQGKPAYEYVDKLGRVYFDLPPRPGSAMTFGARLEAAVNACVAQVKDATYRDVDVVLLDSRSGIHDIAAVAITQLSSLALLFATDTPQTWDGYSQLFRRWQTRLQQKDLSEIRGRLKMVAAMVPSASNIAEYLENFADRAQTCFASTIYDEAPPDDFDQPYNFAPTDREAPHYPLPIYHRAELIGRVPGFHKDWLASSEVTSAYADFLNNATALIERMAEEGEDNG